MNHNWSATKQCLHPQSVAEISRLSVLSGDRIRQCETSSGSLHKDTDQCLQVAIFVCRHSSVPVPCENGSAETTVAEGGLNESAPLPHRQSDRHKNGTDCMTSIKAEDGNNSEKPGRHAACTLMRLMAS